MIVISKSQDAKILTEPPFIYKIRERYYVIGKGICKEIQAEYKMVGAYYRDFMHTMGPNAKRPKYWPLFLRLISIANLVKRENGEDPQVLKTLRSLRFRKAQKEELGRAVDYFSDFLDHIDFRDLSPLF